MIFTARLRHGNFVNMGYKLHIDQDIAKPKQHVHYISLLGTKIDDVLNTFWGFDIAQYQFVEFSSGISVYQD